MVIPYILFLAFIKIKFNFWSKQPVFHIYNLFYWVWPQGIIQHEQPPKTKFYNEKIMTQTFENTSAEKKALFYTLIQSHFLRDKRTNYNQPKHAISEYFKAHNSKSHISLQFEKVLANTLQSAMTTRPLNAVLNDHEFKLHYVDFLCIHKKHRKMGLAPQIIYSHYYNVRQLEKNPVFLFKREGTINLIVPLTVYNAHVFSLKYLKQPNLELANNVICHMINDANFSLFSHFFGSIKDNFKCCITPELSHVKHLVAHKLIFICLIMVDNEPVATYIYRTPHTSYDGKPSIECIASYYKIGFYDVFIKSFRNTIALINQVYPIDILVMENISNNNDILSHLLKKHAVLWKCPMAYFLYNFSHRPFFSTDVFLIN